MLTLHEIRHMTNLRTYDKGVGLYNKNKFITFYYDTEEDGDYIHSLVKGSGINEYQVDIVYDDVLDDIGEYRCECPAFHNYPGPCKHVVAALLMYIDKASAQEMDNGAGFDEVLDRFEASVHSGKTFRDYYSNDSIQEFLEKMQGGQKVSDRAAKGRRTTPEIGQLFQSSDHYDFQPLLEEAATKLVKLEPYINVAAHKITVEFKIGHERMYVLKDVWEFCTRIMGKSHHTYGKSLAFTHEIEAFEDGSKDIVRFIMKIIDSMRSRYQYGTQIKRELPLSVDELIELINALRTDTIQTSLGWDYTYQPYTISAEKMNRKMKIEGIEDGLDVTVEQLLGYTGERYYIYFVEETIYIVDVTSIEPIRGFLTTMARYSDRKVFIAKEDVKGFCRYLLPALEDHYTIDWVNFMAETYAIQQASFELYLDLPEHDVISCKVMAVYGERKVNLFDSDDSELRDSVTEKKVNHGISTYFNGYDVHLRELYLQGDERRFYNFLTEGLVELQSYGEVFVSDKLKKINVISHSPVKVGVSIASDLLELKIHSDELSPKELTEILMHYNPKKKYYRLKNGDFINVEDGELEVLHELTNGLNLTKKDLAGQTVSLPKYRALYIDEQLKKGHGGPVTRGKSFKSLIKNMKTVEENDFDIPVSLDSTLRTYQKSGFLWMKTLKENGFGGILADDMGLGKTLQVITMLKSDHLTLEDPGRTLIVCPSSLVYNWHREFEKFAPDMAVTTVTGSPSIREKLISEAAQGAILVTSYDLLKRDIHYYKEQTFSHQIIDEAQYIKNSNTKAAKAVKAVDARFKLALTGTPIENRLSELWSIFDYLMPGFLYSYKKFKSDLELPVVQNQDEQVTARLRQMITPFILRRLKKDVLTDLPDKMEEDVIIPIEGEQRRVYDARVALLKNELSDQSTEDFNTSKIKVLAELTRLRQLCCDPAMVYDNYKDGSAKTERCMNLIQEAVDGGHKVLLFSQFTSLFESIHLRLDAQDISYFTLTGKTSKEKRMKLVESFNVDETSVFCISLKAGGTGLNLTSADIVIHFDPWWNVAVQNQATDRAHRIGQKNVVNVYKLIVKDSIEEKIVALQERKKALADQMLTGEKIGFASFSKKDLLEILG